MSPGGESRRFHNEAAKVGACPNRLRRLVGFRDGAGAPPQPARGRAQDARVCPAVVHRIHRQPVDRAVGSVDESARSVEDTPRPRDWSENFPERPCAAPSRRHRTSPTHSSGSAGSVRTKIRTTARRLAGGASRWPGDEGAGVGVRTGSVGSVTSTGQTKGPCDSYSQGPFTYLRIDCATAYGSAPMPAPACCTRVTRRRPRTVRTAPGNRPQEFARTCAQVTEPVDDPGGPVDDGQVPEAQSCGAPSLACPATIAPGSAAGPCGDLLHRKPPILLMNERFLWTGMRFLWTDRPFPETPENSFRKGLCARPATA